jgi:hypothetical protein
MADLLSSLEIGMTRTVGAASRIRNQVRIIEDYMDAQRQQELASSASNPAYLKHEPLPGATNAPTDPSLQTTPGAVGLYQQPANDFDFKGNFPSDGIDGITEGQGQFQFQLPPELLEGWPWPFDMSHPFGGF